MIRAELGVQSLTTSAADISRALQREPDMARERGTPSWNIPGASAQFHLWAVRVEVAGPHFGSPGGLSAAICSLGETFAARLGELSHAECEVILSIVQDVEGADDRASLGINLTAQAVAWLAKAGASVDVDQYLG